MQGALDWMQLGTLEGKHVAMQGTGNVAGYMAGLLLDAGVSKVTAVDISEASVAALRQRFDDPRLELRVVTPGDDSIFETPCDVFAPNALGGVLNPDTIGRLRTKLVCGAANNQLLDDARDAIALRDRNIPIVPDFVANRMGIVQCANEQYGCLPSDPAILRHFDPTYPNSVFAVTQAVLQRAHVEGTTTAAAANALADEACQQVHPLWPQRGRDVVAALIEERWAER
jgi:glutamate dehydrogenase/leucine dehydrogenase